MQSILPPTVTPGWNDPPNLGGAAAPTASNRLSHLRKRLVDPSISVRLFRLICTYDLRMSDVTAEEGNYSPMNSKL
ncbi:hypothetical protein NECAME_18152 [Necator americanus]|uniref:Uncharacterized protein n=1 Tax=Necator americanus TaxID=51031 RepID=W2TDR7_NECAM|nr:hypothetical protein NECAME_18152 [Necator americanus]ETN79316.1 hypothetical protein NECAME_18152 [Necator americanus]